MSDTSTYISTRGTAPALNFEDAMLGSLASDGGLYVPRQWATLSRDTIASFADMSYAQTAAAVLSPLIGEGELRDRLPDFIRDAYANFTSPEVAPLTPLSNQQYLLELYHGPSFAFKDIAMQLLARMMDDALIRRNRTATIIGATSGDTGSAAISAFRGREAVDIFILYPHGRVSEIQRRQMTTHADENVFALAIDGTFDDCQALVKTMFNDTKFREQSQLAGINSINWARVAPQVVYYFTAAAKLGAPEQEVAFSVPTGNFGDIFAGFVAAKMGLPIKQLMIATNVNDILVRTLQSGKYEVRDVAPTHSPSMDIQVSSNFERLLFEASGRDAAAVCNYMNALAHERAFTLAQPTHSYIKEIFAGASIDEAQTLEIMRTTKAQNGLAIDPHSAVGVGAAQQMQLDDTPIISLATAHPAKFADAATKAFGAPIELPALAKLKDKQERNHLLPNSLAAVQEFIRQHKR